MIAILVYEGFGVESEWARVDLALSEPPELEPGSRYEEINFLSGEREIYRTGVQLPGRVEFQLPQPALDTEVMFGRTADSSQYTHPTNHRNLASLLLDALLSARIVEIILYQTGAARGVAFQGEVCGGEDILLLGDYSTGDNREPGGQVPGTLRVELVPKAYGIVSDVEQATTTWLAGEAFEEPT